MSERETEELDEQGYKLLLDIIEFSGSIGNEPNFILDAIINDRKVSVDVNITVRKEE